MINHSLYILSLGDERVHSVGLDELLGILRKKWLLIVSIVMLAMGISAIASFFIITPIYQASTQILVSRAAANSESPQIDASLNEDAEYVKTYSVIMKSPYVLNQVIDELDLNTNFKELKKSVTVTQEDESHVVTVHVEHEDASQAVIVADEIATVFQREISQLMGIKNVTILSTAEEQQNSLPVKPNPMINIAAGLIVGIVFGVGIAILLDYFDHTIKTEQDAEKVLGAVILGAVGDMAYEMNDKKQVRAQELERRQLNV